MNDFQKITEQDSPYANLDQMDINQCLTSINQEDQKVAIAVNKAIPQIQALVEKIVHQLSNGGRLIYIGAGTSGRLGILDASECPPTFGVADTLVMGLIAGGDAAIRKAVEHAEDQPHQAWEDLKAKGITSKDVVVGIAASGTTPYVVGGIKDANENKLITGCITCNPNSPLSREAQFPIEVVVGPEFVTGSSRMKAGTAQKLVLNMISTTTMIQLGKVKGNKMVDMQLSNAKLNQRAIQMLINLKDVDENEAKRLLSQHGSVRKALTNE